MIRLWAECIIVRPCTATIVSLTFAKYSVKLLFPECDPPDERLISSLFSLFSSSSSSSSLADPHPQSHHNFHNHDLHCHRDSNILLHSVRMLAAGCICLLAFINCWSVKAATKVFVMTVVIVIIVKTATKVLFMIIITTTKATISGVAINIIFH